MTTDARILTALRGTGDSAVSGAELSEQLGVTRAAIWARIEELRKLGYEIEASPHEGYRLLHSPDALHPDDLIARLGRARIVGRDIRVFRETTSTNDVIEKLARDGVAEGVVVFAESQTQGRGRLGRAWKSPAGLGLWFSVLLRPELRPQEATRITVATATALRRAIHSEIGLAPDIKWPNDLLIKGRKVCGILTELRAELDRVRYIIVGVGVDVNQTARDFPAELRKHATSLRAETGTRVDRASLATALLRELDRDYARLLNGAFDSLVEEWEAGCTTLGHNVSIRIGERSIRGRAESLDKDGALLVRTEHGRLEPVIGGDVLLEK